MAQIAAKPVPPTPAGPLPQPGHRLGPKNLWLMLKQSAIEWIDDDAFGLSAALSYYTIFSLAPLLIVMLFVVELFWEGQSAAAQANLLAQIGELAGDEGADLVKTMLDNASRSGAGGLATLLGIGALLVGATGVFVQLQRSLNRIWEVAPKPGGGLKGLLRARALSFGVILGVGFLMLVSLVVSAGLGVVDDLVTGLTPGLHVLMWTLGLVVSFTVLTLLFAMIYRYLPDVEIGWHDVLVGAALTALLFTVGKYGIGLYLGNSGAASAYGAAGSLAVLLLWIYYSSLIVFFGAEFTQIYARHHGRRIRPNRHAIRLLDEPVVPDEPLPTATPLPATALPVRAAQRPGRSKLKRAGVLLFVFLLGRQFGK